MCIPLLQQERITSRRAMSQRQKQKNYSRNICKKQEERSGRVRRTTASYINPGSLVEYETKQKEL